MRDRSTRPTSLLLIADSVCRPVLVCADIALSDVARALASSVYLSPLSLSRLPPMSSLRVSLEGSPARQFEVDVQPFDDLPKLRDKLFLLHNLQLQDYTLHLLGGVTSPSALSESVPVSALGVGKGSVLIARRKDATAAVSPSSEAPPVGSMQRGHHHSTSSSGSIPRSPLQQSVSPMHSSSGSGSGSYAAAGPPALGHQLSVPLAGRRPSTGDPFAQLEDTLSLISPRQQAPGTPRTPSSMGPGSPMQGAMHSPGQEHARRPSGQPKKYNTLPHAHARSATTVSEATPNASGSLSPRQHNRPQLSVAPPSAATAAVTAHPPAGMNHPPLSRALSSPLSPPSSNPFHALDAAAVPPLPQTSISSASPRGRGSFSFTQSAMHSSPSSAPQQQQPPASAAKRPSITTGSAAGLPRSPNPFLAFDLSQPPAASANVFDRLEQLSPGLTAGSSLGGPRRMSTSTSQQHQAQHQSPSPHFQASSGSFPSSTSLPRSLSISAHSESNFGSTSGTPPLAPSPSHAASAAAAAGSGSRRGSLIPAPVSVAMPTANTFYVMDSASSPQERRGARSPSPSPGATIAGAAALSAPDALASLFGLSPTPVHPSPALVEASANASVLAASPHLSVLLEAVRHESSDQARDRDEQLELRGFKLAEVQANVEKMITSRAALLESHAAKLAEINERIREAQVVESAEQQKCSAQQRELDREKLTLMEQLHSIERRTDQHALDLTQRRLALDTWAATDRRAQLGGLALQREEHDAAWRQDRDRLVDRTVEQLLMAGEEFADAVLDKLTTKIEAKKKLKLEAAAAVAASSSSSSGINRSRRSSDAANPPAAAVSASLSPDPVLLAIDRLSSNQRRPSADAPAAASAPAVAAPATVDAAAVSAPAANS